MLKDNEIDILKYIADGLNNKEIAIATKYAEASLEMMRRKLYEKLEVKNAPHAVAWGFRNGYLK